MSDRLKKLFVTFEGNTKKMAWATRQFPNYQAFVQALDAVEWKLVPFEKSLQKRHEQAIQDAEAEIAKGAAQRRKLAADAAKVHAKQASVGSENAKALLQDWFELKAEFKARGYDRPDAVVVDLSYLEAGTQAKAGDATAMGLATFAEELLAKEPLVLFARRAAAFVNQARDTLAHLQGKVGVLHSYKDSIAEVQKVIQAAQKLSDDVSALFDRHAPKARPMSVAEQSMVPGAKDLAAVQRKLQDVEGIRTPSQAWALAGAEKKGEDEQALYRAKAIERLQQLNGEWGTNYKVGELDVIMQTLVSGRITTNYFLSKAPGANTEAPTTGGPKPTPLVQLLMGSDNFKNVWETGKSQASTDLKRRGGVEEAMGYGTALKRTQGTAQTVSKSEDARFEPADKGEMPKYAAVTSGHQKDGVAPRYGDSIVIWKESLRERVTHTPGDSWSKSMQGVDYLTSGKHPEVIFAHADALLVRLAAAEATGKDAKWLQEVKDKGGVATEAYIETQVHGDLTWDDVQEIVVGEADADDVVRQLTEFARAKGYGFTVRKK